MSPPDRPTLGPLVAALVAAALLAWLALAGRVGSDPPERLVERFVAAVDRGDLRAVEALLADDPTIVSWMPALPRAPNSATMALIDLGRAREVSTADPAPLADYLGYAHGLASATHLSACESSRPRVGAQRLLYDAWLECRFTATNDLMTAVTGGRAELRGSVRFGLAGGKVRAVLVDAEPSPDLDPMWDFMQWVWQEHPDEFRAWLLGPFRGPVISGDSAHALRRLAEEFTSERGGSSSWVARRGDRA